jgi:hypothetical protein
MQRKKIALIVPWKHIIAVKIAIFLHWRASIAFLTSAYCYEPIEMRATVCIRCYLTKVSSLERGRRKEDGDGGGTSSYNRPEASASKLPNSELHPPSPNAQANIRHLTLSWSNRHTYDEDHWYAMKDWTFSEFIKPMAIKRVGNMCKHLSFL